MVCLNALLARQQAILPAAIAGRASKVRRHAASMGILPRLLTALHLAAVVQPILNQPMRAVRMNVEKSVRMVRSGAQQTG